MADNVLKISKEAYLSKIILLLDEKRYWDATRMMWPKSIIDCKPTRDIIDAVWNEKDLTIIGHAAASKTFTVISQKYLKWISLCVRASLCLNSTTLTSLKSRAWGDLLLLRKSAKVSSILPGYVINNPLMIKREKEDNKHIICAVASDKPDSVTKAQGLHTEIQDLVIDEADNPYNEGIFSAVANFMASGDFSVVKLANPRNRNSILGQNCEPVNGWDSIEINTDKKWKSKTGSTILRLDGFDSPNIKAGKDIYPFLLTNAAVEKIKNQFGTNSIEWFAFVRGWFPPEHLVSVVFPAFIVNQLIERQVIFYAESHPVAGCDPALEGGARCVVCLGKGGVSADNPQKCAGRAEEFVTIKRRAGTKLVTVDYAEQIRDLCISRGVQPKNFAIDCTGAGSGISDHLRYIWSDEILRVNFGAAASKSKILLEDSMDPCDRFRNMMTELWWAGRELGRAGQLCLHPKCVDRDLRIQLEDRRYTLGTHTNNEKIRIESKGEMMERNLHSPDDADAFMLFAHVIRSRFGSIIASGLPEEIERHAISMEESSMPRVKPNLMEMDYSGDGFDVMTED